MDGNTPLTALTPPAPAHLSTRYLLNRLVRDEVRPHVGRLALAAASMATYAAAFDDALGTFDSLGARAELPRLMHDLVHRGVEAGHADDQLTALVKVLGES